MSASRPTPADFPNITTRNHLIADAQSLPDLIRKAQTLDPDLAGKFAGKALIASKSVWGNALALILTPIVTHYGLGWDDQTVALVTGAIVMAATIIFRALTDKPVTGILSAPPASITATVQGGAPLAKAIGLLFVTGFAASLASCGQPMPSQAAQDIALASAALQAALAAQPGITIPPAVTAALADLQAEASAFAAADGQAAQQTVVKRVEADINAVVAAAAGTPGLPLKAQTAIQLTSALLPIIEMEVNMVPPASANSGTSADQLRNGLRNPG